MDNESAADPYNPRSYGAILGIYHEAYERLNGYG